MPVDIATLGAEALRLADRGARELFGRSLHTLLSDLASAGESLDPFEFDGLVIAGGATGCARQELLVADRRRRPRSSCASILTSWSGG